jgi:Zn-dependent protease with chaperone function
MTKRAIFFVTTFLLTAETAYADQSLFSKFYCMILGNKDVRQEYKDLAYQALAQLGVSDPASVPIKQMNGVGPSFARVDLSSFTAFGIWLNEGYLDNCSQEEKLFHIYHEASHYVSNHHEKNLVASALAGAVAIFGGAQLGAAVVSENNTWLKYSVAIGSTLIACAGIYLGLLPQVVKRQEKQADMQAVQALMEIGKEQVVDAHIKQVSSEPVQENTIWWYSNAEQVAYLKRAKGDVQSS